MRAISDIAALGTLPTLRHLTIDAVGVGRRDEIQLRTLRPLAHAAALESVEMPNVTIADASVAALIGLQQLRRVKLYGDFTDLVGTRTNADAERRVITRIRTERPDMLARLDFDTEADAVTVRGSKET